MKQAANQAGTNGPHASLKSASDRSLLTAHAITFFDRPHQYLPHIDSTGRSSLLCMIRFKPY